MSVNIEGEYEEFYFAVYNRDLTDEYTFPDDMFYEDLNMGYTLKSMIMSVPMDTEMTVVAVAYDAMFMPSKLFRKVICLTKDGVSEPETFKTYGGEPEALTLRTMSESKPTMGDIRIDRKQSVEIVVSDADRKAIEQQRKTTLQAEVAKRLESRKREARRIAR